MLGYYNGTTVADSASSGNDDVQSLAMLAPLQLCNAVVISIDHIAKGDRYRQ